MVVSMDRWKGKVAIVTGASTGIGAAIAALLVKEGLKVVGIARRAENIEEQAKKLSKEKGKLYAVKADLTKEEDVLAAFKWVKDNVGPVHILVNNAGLMQLTTLTDGDTQKWKRTFDVNVLALCIATREAVKVMKENKIDGHIIHINSLAGHGMSTSGGPAPMLNVYPASKCAVTALTETLRQELNQLGLKIKITSVSPGATRSEFQVAAGYKMDKIDAKQLEMLKSIPFLEAEDVADAVVYALSTPCHVQVHELIMRPLLIDSKKK